MRRSSSLIRTGAMSAWLAGQVQTGQQIDVGDDHARPCRLARSMSLGLNALGLNALGFNVARISRAFATCSSAVVFFGNN